MLAAATQETASHVSYRMPPAVAVHPPRLATVLLIDDDPDTRLLVRCLLGRTGRFEVVGEAGSAREGIVRATATQPDFIVLDVQMPGMTGLEALPKIREACPESRVVVFSGLDASRFAPAAEDRGAAAVLEKGSDCSTLVPKLLALDAHVDGDLAGPRAPWD